MKIYTRTGDEGDTGLFGGGRVPKHDRRVAAYGAVDELNAVLGQARLSVADAWIGSRLEPIQHDLFAIGATLATPVDEGRTRPTTPDLPERRVTDMEAWIDAAEEDLEPLRNFILPGGSPGAAGLHVCRTVCRRAERAVSHLGESEGVEGVVLRYLNRLSDLLFTLARLENARAGVPDVVWTVRPEEGGEG
jgi:cob(I)alamin adenosyltransferase